MSDEGEQLRIAEAECNDLDMAYARLRLAQIDCSAQQAISTLPKPMRKPFLKIILIAQNARRGLLDG